MQLIAIGESVKRLDRVTAGDLLVHHPAVEWRRIMGMRDVLSHHCFDVDAEVVFTVCKERVGELHHTLERTIHDLTAA
jgi:uncharacterized protein with HEPN domain